MFALFFFFQRVVQNNRHRKGRKIRGESISALGLLLIYLCVCVGVRSCLVCLTVVLLSRSQRDSRQFFCHHIQTDTQVDDFDVRFTVVLLCLSVISLCIC